MNATELTANLQREAAYNPVLNDVCHVLAKRIRNRRVLNIRALYNRMEQAGYNYSREQYADALAILSKLGVGKLERNRIGRVVGLSGIRVKLQDIGQMIDSNNFYKGPPVANKTNRQTPPPAKVVESEDKQTNGYTTDLSIHFSMNGKKIVIQIPESVADDKISSLIEWVTKK